MEANGIELGFDQPLSATSALENDKLGRKGFAEAAVRALRRVSGSAGFVLSIEGAWGSGKTSTLAMMEAVLHQQDENAIIVRFNPWLVGDRDALLGQFLARIANDVSIVDHASDGKKVASQLKSYAKVFDLMRIIPGAEPWASLIKSVVEAAGNSTEAIATLKTPDLDARKGKVEKALRQFGRRVIVFIDDIDRLFPREVFEMVRIIKAVGDLPNVGYVVAWDSEYVAEALSGAGVPRAATYIDKIVQVRLPLPAIGLECRRTLIDNALRNLEQDALRSHFPNSEDRFGSIYFGGLRDLLEQPRDFARVFNVVSVLEPELRGEVVLSDIIGLAALMIKAPPVYALLRSHPRWFVGHLVGDDEGIFTKVEEIIAEGADEREKAIKSCGHPHATRKLVHRLFPLTMRADDTYGSDRAREIEGHIGSPARLLVALQLNIGATDVSLVSARQYMVRADRRSMIVSALSEHNCLEFLERLADVVESAPGLETVDVKNLCLDIARLADQMPFSARSRDKSRMFSPSADRLAIEAINSIIRIHAPQQASAIADAIAADAESLSVAMRLFDLSFVVTRKDEDSPQCSKGAQGTLTRSIRRNLREAARTGRILDTCNPGHLMWRFADLATQDCPKVFNDLRNLDPTLDSFVLPLLNVSYDSVKGKIFSLPEDRSKIEAYCSFAELKRQAKSRLKDGEMTFPMRAAWTAVLEETGVYAVDGTYAR